MDSYGLVVILVATLVWIALFLLFRQFVLWYFRINERTELLRDIRDELRQPRADRSWSSGPVGAAATEQSPDPTRRRVGEDDDTYNSRMASQIERQIGR